ncbi:LLM class flavin-dependent oxidoreductase [Amycolatopsis sp. K13G38]|uniref:LLM class flavin-dependent oxidoreductase n=1 Tax=Amycolatopsis acididurans TaxID=2724524 RepID=A0ABX1J0A8_9PSEU|nr:LLM class flavin-dependent oxidoreductase [Amycolatopsis acididurans]NKQ51706.1 LLM class flavin-dependent oxidoreductase [Amycolatopsis acididurans]
MRIGLRVPPCAPLPELAEFVREVEAAGFDEAWFPDSQLLWRDVFAVAATAGMATSHLTIGTAVTNVVTRHPAVVASAARTVAEAAPGRFVLGVGVGNSSVGPVGLAPSKQAGLRSGIAVVRELLDGHKVDFAGVKAKLRDPVAVPVHIAASGPRNLRLAGEIADGVILLSGISPGPLAAALAAVQSGVDSAGRAPVPATVSAFCRVTDDIERDARDLKPICLTIAGNGGAAFFAKAGIHVEVPDRLPEVYPDLVHAESWPAAVEACDPYVGDEAVVAFARQFCLFGTLGEISARLKEVADAGVASVLLQHVGSYDLPRDLLEVAHG